MRLATPKSRFHLRWHINSLGLVPFQIFFFSFFSFYFPLISGALWYVLEQRSTTLLTTQLQTTILGFNVSIESANGPCRDLEV